MEVSRNAEQKSVQALLEWLLFLFGGKEHFVRITNCGCFSRAENGSRSEGRFVLRVWIIWFRFFLFSFFFFPPFVVEAWRWLNVLSAGNYQEIWVFSWISLRWYTALGVIQESSVTRQSFCRDNLNSQSFKLLHQQAFYFLFWGVCFHLRNWNNSLIPFMSFLRRNLFFETVLSSALPHWPPPTNLSRKSSWLLFPRFPVSRDWYP